MSDTLSLQARIAATPSKVFHALTDETAVTTWLAEHAAISLPEQHYGFWGDTTPQGDQTHQTLLSAEPDRLLRFSWTLDGTPTTVEIELQPDGSQTVLRLRQDGLPTLDELMAPTGRRDGLHSMHTFWGLALANLAEYTEGRPLTPKADFRPKRAPEIRVRMEIDATPHEVFESLIDPTQIARWFGWEVDPTTPGRSGHPRSRGQDIRVRTRQDPGLLRRRGIDHPMGTRRHGRQDLPHVRAERLHR